jgi:hypothetical protein
MDKYLDEAGKAWAKTYEDLWKTRHMEFKVRKIVSTTFDDEWKKISWTDWVKVPVSEEVLANIATKTIERSQAEFAHDYEDFMSSVGERYTDELRDMMSRYFDDLLAMRRDAGKDLPGIDAIIRNQMGLNGTRMLENLMPTNGTDVSGLAVGPRDAKEAAVGATIFLIRYILKKKIVVNLVRSLGAAVSRKLIIFVKGPIGWTIGSVLIVYDGITIGKKIMDIPEELKTNIATGMTQEFQSTVPKMIWEQQSLSKDVRERLKKVADAAGGGIDRIVEEFVACPDYKKFAESLGEKEKDDLVVKLFLLRDTAPLCKLVASLAPVLVEAGPEQINCIKGGIERIGLDLAVKWINLAPQQRICQLLKLKASDLVLFEPNRENLARLIWTIDLPQQCRQVAMALQKNDKDTADWIANNLDRREQIALLSDRTMDQVKSEVKRRQAPPPHPLTLHDLLDRIISLFGRIVEPFVPIEKIREFTGPVFTLIIVLVLCFVIAIPILLLRKLGVFRLFRWLLKDSDKNRPKSSG